MERKDFIVNIVGKRFQDHFTLSIKGYTIPLLLVHGRRSCLQLRELNNNLKTLSLNLKKLKKIHLNVCNNNNKALPFSIACLDV